MRFLAYLLRENEKVSLSCRGTKYLQDKELGPTRENGENCGELDTGLCW